MTIREMIIDASERLNPCQPGPKARRAKPADRVGDPERPNRAEETPLFPVGWRVSMDNGLCRVVGFIPLFKG